MRGNDNDPSFAAATEIDALAERLGGRGITADVRQPVQVEVPAEEILRVADEAGAALVVSRLRRRALGGKRFLGRTSQHIIIAPERPVGTGKRPARGRPPPRAT